MSVKFDWDSELQHHGYTKKDSPLFVGPEETLDHDE
jgi:hypothetical protein